MTRIFMMKAKKATLISVLAIALGMSLNASLSFASTKSLSSLIAIKPTVTPLVEDELTLGENAYRSGEWDKAVQLLTQYLLNNPDSMKALVFRGKIYFYQGKTKLASADISKAIQLEAQNSDELSYHAEALTLAGYYDLAINDLQIAINEEPGNTKYYVQLGQIYVRRGDYENALAQASKLIQIDPKKADGYVYTANIYEYQKKYDLAIAALNKAAAIDPQNPTTFNNLGWIHGLSGNGDQAVKNCLKAVKLKPKTPAYLDTCGLAYFAKGNMQLSIKYYDEAIGLAPGAPMATTYCYRGRSHQKAGNKTKAIEDYKVCLKLNKNGELVQIAQDGLKLLNAK